MTGLPGLFPVHLSYTSRPVPQDLPSQNIGSPQTWKQIWNDFIDLDQNVHASDAWILEDLAVRGEAGERGVDQLGALERHLGFEQGFYL